MKNKTKNLIFILAIVFIIVWFLSGIFIDLSTFIVKRLSFNIDTTISGQTHIVNNNFRIDFIVKDRCDLKTNFNGLVVEEYKWYGYLSCERNKINILISEHIPDFDDFKKINDIDRFWLADSNDDWQIIILENNQKMLISGYYNTQNLKQDIINTLQEL